MHILIRVFNLALVCSTAISAVPEMKPRVTANFNQGWKFKLGDTPEAAAPAFDDSVWQSIGLPHSFSIPYFLSPDFYTGYGWYRKTFEAPAAWTGKRIALEFEAAFQEAEIFLNGEKVGDAVLRTYQGRFAVSVL